MTTESTQYDADDVVHMLMLPLEEGGSFSRPDSTTAVTDSRDASSSSLFTSISSPALAQGEATASMKTNAQTSRRSPSKCGTPGKNHWYSAWDPKTGKKYYFNQWTGCSQWEKPKPKHFKKQPRSDDHTSPKTNTSFVHNDHTTPNIAAKNIDLSLEVLPTRDAPQESATLSSSLSEWEFDVIPLDDISEHEPFIQDSILNRTQRASTDPPGTVQRAFSCGASKKNKSGGVQKPNLRRAKSDCHLRSKRHMRRFTGGCIIEEERYQDDSIETAIKCTSECILDLITLEENRKQPLRSPVSVQDFNSSSRSLTLFDDDIEDYDIDKDISESVEQEATTMINEEEFKTYFDLSTQTTPKKGSITKRGPQLPSVRDVISFFHEIHAESNLEREVVIIALLYMERLTKASHNQLAVTRRNWRSILHSSIHLANKVWGEDQANHFQYSTTDTDGLLDKIFSEQRIDRFEWALLKGLNYNVKVTARDYAKSYFLVRSKVTMSGLSDCSLNFEPIDFNGMKSLEDVSSRYEHQKKRTAEKRRVKSMVNLSFLQENAAFS